MPDRSHDGFESSREGVEDVGGVRHRQVHDAEVEPRVGKALRVIDDLVDVECATAAAEVRRRRDLGRIASDGVTVPPQHITLGEELLHGAAGEVPMLREARDRTEGAPLAAATDADRRVRLLERLGVAAGVLELDVLPLERRGLVRQQPDDRLAPFVERVEPLSQRGMEVDAVGARLLLVPARADAELEPPTGDDVERRGHVGQHRGVAVGHAGHQHAHAEPLGGLREGGGRDPALQARTGRVGVDRIEVVERPSRLEQLDLVGGLPDGQHVRPGCVLWSGLQCKAHPGIVP